jgi:DNA modification methylase
MADKKWVVTKIYSQSSFLGDADSDDYQEVGDKTDERTVENHRKKANELDGKTWLRYSISVWSDIRKSPEEVALNHPAIFPVALAGRLIEIFTNSEQKIVFDPFVGVGSTVVAAQSLGKHGIGIELNPEFAEKAEMRFQQIGLLNPNEGSHTIHCANAFDLLEYVEQDSVDLVITSPPYWDILNMKRSADYKEIRTYSNEEADLGNVEDYGQFLEQLKLVFEKVYQVMKAGAYCCVIVMDLRKKDKFYPFHSDIASFMQEVGFIYDDIIIWDRRHEYNNMRPLGYPSVFRVNKAHEFILIFQKPK